MLNIPDYASFSGHFENLTFNNSHWLAPQTDFAVEPENFKGQISLNFHNITFSGSSFVNTRFIACKNAFNVSIKGMAITKGNRFKATEGGWSFI